MTDRFHSLTVALAEDTRDDDAEAIIAAIGMIKGVLAVKGNVADSASWMAETRARNELGAKLMKVVYPDRGAKAP